MNNIDIYESEKNDGLEKAVANNISVCEVKLHITNVFDKGLEKARASLSPENIGLYKVPSILASVGWNKNTDVFLPEELFNARSTPVNKPFNYMHKESDIIGHTIASYVFTQDGELWLENQCPTVPFDIIDDSVIYTIYEEPENIERINKIIAEIEEGKWFVSMECVFPNFDYAFINSDGTHEIVTRNKETAFLTKYLKSYGGPGQFNGKAIGRVLRNFVFSGKGLVDRPANERSIILNGEQSESIKSGEEMEELQAKLDEVTKNHEAAVASLTESASANEELNATVATLQETVDSLTKEVASLKEALEVKTAEASALVEELTSSKAAFIKTTRAIKLVRAGIEDERAEELLTKFASSSEEIFDEFVALAAKKEKSEKAMKEAECEDNTAKCNEAETEIVTVDAEAIDSVEVPQEPALATAGLADENGEVFKSAAKWVENIFSSSKARK